jgi:hypothetical protein
MKHKQTVLHCFVGKAVGALGAGFLLKIDFGVTRNWQRGIGNRGRNGCD